MEFFRTLFHENSNFKFRISVNHSGFFLHFQRQLISDQESSSENCRNQGIFHQTNVWSRFETLGKLERIEEAGD